MKSHDIRSLSPHSDLFARSSLRPPSSSAPLSHGTDTFLLDDGPPTSVPTLVKYSKEVFRFWTPPESRPTSHSDNNCYDVYSILPSRLQSMKTHDMRNLSSRNDLLAQLSLPSPRAASTLSRTDTANSLLGGRRLRSRSEPVSVSTVTLPLSL